MSDLIWQSTYLRPSPARLSGVSLILLWRFWWDWWCNGVLALEKISGDEDLSGGRKDSPYPTPADILVGVLVIGLCGTDWVKAEADTVNTQRNQLIFFILVFEWITSYDIQARVKSSRLVMSLWAAGNWRYSWSRDKILAPEKCLAIKRLSLFVWWSKLVVALNTGEEWWLITHMAAIQRISLVAEIV